MLVVVGIEDEYPLFGTVQDIFITGANCVKLHVQVYNTESYNEHFHGYVVGRSRLFQ